MTDSQSEFKRPGFDPGLSQKVGGELRRAIEHDGSFNVRRRGKRYEGLHAYQYLITCSWPTFLTLLGVFLVGVNLIFAAVYWVLGTDHLHGIPQVGAFEEFLYDFFFSVQTFTSVGYGAIAPQGITGGFVSSVEALVGLLAFALATGLLFARFSRPSARILFSRTAIVAPYQDKTALMFRIVNQRGNVMIDLTCDVLFSWIDVSDGREVRKYASLQLERASIYFFPFPWTIVHPIDHQSPFWGLKEQELASRRAEVMIVVRGYDDTFSQSVHVRDSYRFDEIEFGRRFVPIFSVDNDGMVIVNVDRIDETESVTLPV